MTLLPWPFGQSTEKSRNLEEHTPDRTEEERVDAFTLSDEEFEEMTEEIFGDSPEAEMARELANRKPSIWRRIKLWIL